MNDERTQELSQPLDPKLVSTRKGAAGRTVPYIEGYVAIDQANAVFGFDGWGYEVIGNVQDRALPDGQIVYIATVQVTALGVTRMDVGFNAVNADTPDGHDAAYKGAVTDALKRALRSFGAQFGNSLYAGTAQPAQQQRTAPKAQQRAPQREAPPQDIPVVGCKCGRNQHPANVGECWECRDEAQQAAQDDPQTAPERKTIVDPSAPSCPLVLADGGVCGAPTKPRRIGGYFTYCFNHSSMEKQATQERRQGQ